MGARCTTRNVFKSTTVSDGFVYPLFSMMRKRPSGDWTIARGRSPTGRCLPPGAILQPLGRSVSLFWRPGRAVPADWAARSAANAATSNAKVQTMRNRLFTPRGNLERRSDATAAFDRYERIADDRGFSVTVS